MRMIKQNTIENLSEMHFGGRFLLRVRHSIPCAFEPTDRGYANQQAGGGWREHGDAGPPPPPRASMRTLGMGGGGKHVSSPSPRK